MASDHLWVHIVFGSLSHKALLYSPSTIRMLKEELSLRHGVSVEGMEVWYEDVQQEDKTRVVDGRHYRVYVPAHQERGAKQAVEEGVFLGEGVTLTQEVVVAHKKGAQILRVEEPGSEGVESVYTVFGFRGVIHLVEHHRRCVLSPAGSALPRRKSVFYVDWATIQPLLPTPPVANHIQWVSDQLGKVYGVVEGMYRVQGVHEANVDEVVRYQNVVMNWLDAMGFSEGEEDVDGLEEWMEEEEEEDEEGEYAYEA